MKKILIVDDDIDFLDLLSRLLKKKYHIYKATGINEALRMIEDNTLDAICSDFNMKDGTGLELLEIIRNKGIQLPFLLMSGNEDRYTTRIIQHYGAVSCCKTDPDLIGKIDFITKLSDNR